MGSTGLTAEGLAQLDEVMATHVAEGAVPGVVWSVARDGHVHVGVAGTDGEGRAIGRDEIFRISSNTKPIVAAAALLLVDDGVLGLDEPVDPLLPELADRRVLARPEGPLDDTVPARRPITVRDVLSFRLGYGYDFSATGPQPVVEAMAELGLGAGPPAPAGPPGPDEWMRRLGTLPLSSQPGERWLYHTGAEVLGVLVARAAGQPLDVVLRERVLGPLGMVDTAFSVPDAASDRFGPCWTVDPATGDRVVYDPADGQWRRPPAFPSGGAGLVSTADDLHRFAVGLLEGRALPPSLVTAMTTDQLTEAQRTGCGPSPDGSESWGLGVGVQVRPTPTRPSVGMFGWGGGLGSSWAVDPSTGLIGVLLANQMWTSPEPPALHDDFWTAAFAALDR